MTPDDALKKLEKIRRDLRLTIDGMCRITTIHPEEYSHIIRNPDVYYKLLDVDFYVMRVYEFINKHKKELV